MPMKPQVVTYHLRKLLNDDAIVSADSGTIATWAARYIRRVSMVMICSTSAGCLKPERWMYCRRMALAARASPASCASAPYAKCTRFHSPRTASLRCKAHPGCALAAVCHMEPFHDYERVEHMLFDGALTRSMGRCVQTFCGPALGWSSSVPTPRVMPCERAVE